MNGYQFAHTQTYSLKGNKVNRSVKDVLGENSRQLGQANHVENIRPPAIKYGVDPIELLPLINERIAEAKANLKGTGKRIQSNTHVLEGSVFSHPYTVDELRNNKDAQRRYVSWRNDMMRYAIKDAKSRGLETISVVEHLDESHPHIHVLSIPIVSDDNPRLDAKNCHTGHRASKLSQANGDNPKQQMAEYRSAMKKWQDDIWENVSTNHGLTRIGPRKKRLTRSEWSKDKEAAQQLQQAIEYKQSIENEIGGIHKVKNQNEFLNDEVVHLKNELEALTREFSDFKKQATLDYNLVVDGANEILAKQELEIKKKDLEIEKLTPRTPAFRPR